MQYFTADLHLGHENIIDSCSRPFSSVYDMDGVIIGNINKKVGIRDELYIVGDFCFGNKSITADYRKAIRCKRVHLIRGNHDKLSDKIYIDAGFQSVTQIQVVKARKTQITPASQETQVVLVLCHYAMRTWPLMNRRENRVPSWHLYGHSHGNLPEDPNALSFDIGVDAWKFQPVSFDEVADKMGYKMTYKPGICEKSISDKSSIAQL